MLLSTKSMIVWRRGLGFFKRTLVYSAKASEEDTAWVKSSAGKACINAIQPLESIHYIERTVGLYEYLRVLTEYQSQEQLFSHPSSHRILSQLLTYPLTLSYGVRGLFPYIEPDFLMENLNVCVLGARAEASLPLEWWKHSLFLQPVAKNINIRFLGPGLCVHPSQMRGSSSKGLSVSWKCKSPNIEVLHSLQLSNDIVSDSKTLHEHKDCDDILKWAGVFVLFNPGMGSQALRNGWRPTVQKLLTSRKPVICTALSHNDLMDDESALREFAATREEEEEFAESFELPIKVTPNPYASHQVKLDESGNTIATNHLVYAFQSK